MSKNSIHYLPSGKAYTGEFHKMKGKPHTGAKHTATSKPLSHTKPSTIKKK